MLNLLQKIAIHQLNSDSYLYLIQWWCDKYQKPPNDPLLLDLTYEELYLQYTIDRYVHDKQAFKQDEHELRHGKSVEDWDGKMSGEHEMEMQKRLSKIPKVDLSEWQEEVSQKKDEFNDDYTVDKGEKT